MTTALLESTEGWEWSQKFFSWTNLNIKECGQTGARTSDPLTCSQTRSWLCYAVQHLCKQFNYKMSYCMTKPTKWPVHPVKTQISLGIHPVWTESLRLAWRNTGPSATHWGHNEDWSDWADGWSLPWAHKVILLVLSCSGLNVVSDQGIHCLK